MSSEVPSHPPPSAKPDPYVGTTIDGRYRVESILGEGGMGVVYAARHKVIDKRVAIKVLRSDLAKEREITERFLQEAKSASSIGNPHIIDISDFGELPDGSTYFVMEYLEGKPLGRLLSEVHPLPVNRLVHIAKQIADGLSAAHARGIVHRDLKPDNVFLITRGNQADFVKILDFGIAKVSSVNTKLTRAGSVFGTPHYMSPEQAAGTPVDLRTDVYALGVILYEMASGKVPFDADNFMGILTQHMYKAPVPIRALVPPQDVPPGLEAVVLKALSKKPDQRYQTMDEIAADLEKVGRGVMPDAVSEMMARSGAFNVPADFYQDRGMPHPVPGQPPGRPTRQRYALLAGVVGVVCAVAIVLLVFAKSSSSTASDRAARDQGAGASDGPRASSAAGTPSVSPRVAPLVAPERGTKSVMVAADPLEAHVWINGEDLGACPQTVLVPVGQKVSIELRHEGYRSQALELDGSNRAVTARLARVSSVPPSSPGPGSSKHPPAPTHPQPVAKPRPSTPFGGEVVDPWAH